ncbi:MotA/TolQ/ExbB proton channel family protein [Cardinium endosymbiont of Tipula unca]|uniref:MotA/TolQ/ExbB proton channel family protein n=1 Tax=Cardinium endosymbiont of Tipula unca TaxID=3066216 RepID=UPI0030CD6E89
MNLLLKGGWLMIPLGLLSLLSVYLIIERLLTYRTYLHFSTSFLEEMENQLNHGNMEEVRHLCTPQDNIIQKIIGKGLAHRKTSSRNIELILESESNKAVSFLEENLSLLAMIAGVAPMIGFLGTVTGMIQTFMAIAQEKNQLSSQVFSGGIYEAMVTTVVGLVVGITAYIGYNYCIARVTKTASRLTYLVNLFLAHTT